MAEAFVKCLGIDFSLMIRGNVTDALQYTNAVSVVMPERLRTLYYFFWFPMFVYRQKCSNAETVFMSNDPYLLAIFIFWRKILRFKYRICSDWHQLYDDWRDRYLARNSDYLITTSKRLKGILSSVCDIPSDKILVAYGGINTSLFTEKVAIEKSVLREKLNLPNDAFLVGYVGGFRSVGLEKGLSTMIKALPYIEHQMYMVFVGGAKQYIDEYQLLAEELGVAHRCIFIGKQEFEKVIEYELSMDVLAIPYPDQHHFRDYGFPMKVWEYMASGRPIVYSNLEIIGEILEGRATSFMPDDAMSLAHTLTTLFHERESAEKVGKKNIDDLYAYTWDARVKHIVDFINT